MHFNLSFTEVEEDLETFIDLKQESSEEVVLAQEKQIDDTNKRIASLMKSSLYFPTFRRMERHFSWDTLGEPLSRLADELSVGNHKFIAAISTHDVIKMLGEKRIEIDKGKQKAVDDNYKDLTDRWNFLEELIHDVYKGYNGIYITSDIILGADENKTEDPIPSSHLSSGEKQLLGYLCYNAFSDAEYIFIDEPELSLHPDWQRMLITLLKYQGFGGENKIHRRFFIASHSPYIGIKYEDKSFMLSRR